MGAEWIDFKNKKILYINYSKLSKDEMIDLITKSVRMIVDTKSNENLVLTDIRDAFVNEEFLNVAKEQGKISLPLSKKSAIVGITGIKKILLRTLNSFSPNPRMPFDTLEEAKKWLVE